MQLYTYTCRIIKRHNNNAMIKSDTLFERVVCERELETEQNCNILTLTLLAKTAFLLGCSTALLGAGFLYRVLSPAGLVSKLTDFLSSPSYIIVQCPPSFCGCHKLHSFNPYTVKVILCYSSTRCTFYLHRCISYFDSPAGS